MPSNFIVPDFQAVGRARGNMFRIAGETIGNAVDAAIESRKTEGHKERIYEEVKGTLYDETQRAQLGLSEEEANGLALKLQPDPNETGLEYEKRVIPITRNLSYYAESGGDRAGIMKPDVNLPPEDFRAAIDKQLHEQKTATSARRVKSALYGGELTGDVPSDVPTYRTAGQALPPEQAGPPAPRDARGYDAPARDPMDATRRLREVEEDPMTAKMELGLMADAWPIQQPPTEMDKLDLETKKLDLQIKEKTLDEKNSPQPDNDAKKRQQEILQDLYNRSKQAKTTDPITGQPNTVDTDESRMWGMAASLAEKKPGAEESEYVAEARRVVNNEKNIDQIILEATKDPQQRVLSAVGYLGASTTEVVDKNAPPVYNGKVNTRSPEIRKKFAELYGVMPMDQIINEILSRAGSNNADVVR